MSNKHIFHVSAFLGNLWMTLAGQVKLWGASCICLQVARRTSWILWLISNTAIGRQLGSKMLWISPLGPLSHKASFPSEAFFVSKSIISSIFNLRRYRLNFALRYSSPRVNSNSSVFFSLVNLCQLTVYIKRKSKIHYLEKNYWDAIICSFVSLNLSVLSMKCPTSSQINSLQLGNSTGLS